MKIGEPTKLDLVQKEELEKIILNSKSFSQVAKKLGYADTNGKLNNRIREKAKKLEIDIPFDKQRFKKEEYIGKFFGELEVVGIDEELTKMTKKTHFLCKCHHCNKDKLHSVEITNIKRTKTCGCIKNERFIEGRYEDLTGQTFQHLKVLNLNKEETILHDRTYWDCLCLRCNKNIVPVWAWALKNNLKDNCGCYNVKSKGEEKISSFLIDKGIPFKKEYVFKDCRTANNRPYRFDFAVFDNFNNLQFLIEYNGIQHYEERGWESLVDIQQRDQNKKDYCLKNNIPLYSISYKDFNNIEKILTELLAL